MKSGLLSSVPTGLMSFLAKLFVEGDDRDAAETDVVLQGEPGTVDLAGVGLPAQLPHQLGALGQAGRAQRMPLGEQAPDGFTTTRPP
jgi:hypothetical protein